MKRLLFFLASAVIIALSTKAQSVSSDSNGKVIHIGKTEFVEKIYDYEKNPDIPHGVSDPRGHHASLRCKAVDNGAAAL